MNDIEIQISAIERDTPIDAIAELYGKVSEMVRLGCALKEQLEEKMLELCIANGPIEWPSDMDGNVRKFWAGHSKTTKCKDLRALLNFIITDYSVDELEACLSSSAFKHGAFKKLMARDNTPEKFDEFFEVVVKDKLESGEAAPKQLQSLDTKFLV